MVVDSASHLVSQYRDEQDMDEILNKKSSKESLGSPQSPKTKHRKGIDPSKKQKDKTAEGLQQSVSPRDTLSADLFWTHFQLTIIFGREFIKTPSKSKIINLVFINIIF